MIKKGTAIVRTNGIARFDDWEGLTDEAQLRFRTYMTPEEHELFPLRRPINVRLPRGENGHPLLPDDWADLPYDVQAAYYAQLETDEEREMYPLRELEKSHAHT